MIKFTREISATASAAFEAVYEPELQLDPKEKKALLDYGFCTYMLVDGEPAGEIYGVGVDTLLRLLGEEIEDCEKYPDAIYCYSCTIMPKFQGKGLGKILKAYWLGYVSAYFTEIVGHATSPAMEKINAFFGAEFLKTHKKWYGTKRAAVFYRIKLNVQTAE